MVSVSALSNNPDRARRRHHFPALQALLSTAIDSARFSTIHLASTPGPYHGAISR